MKFVQVLKSVALASALVAGSSFAATIDANSAPIKLLSGSTGTLTLSNANVDPNYNVVGAFGIISAALGAAAPATPNLTYDPDIGSLTDAAVSAPIDHLVTNAAGVVTDVYSLGGLVMTATKNAANASATNGGTLTITNVHGDLVNKILYADVIGANTCSVTGTTSACGTGASATPAYTINANIPVFTFASISGSSTDTTILGAGNHTLLNSLTGLNATAQARAAMAGALALKGLGLSTLQNITNFGTLDTSISVQVSVPEPSTYALFGLGLVAAGFVARRRAR